MDMKHVVQSNVGSVQRTFTTPHISRMQLLVHRANIERRLKDLGATNYDMILPETHTLPAIIHPNETIRGIVYGRYNYNNNERMGRGALVATNFRVVLVDKKPLFIIYIDITYDSISSISYSRVGQGGVITIISRIGTVKIRTLNQICAKNFIAAVENTIFNMNRTNYGYT